MKKEILDKLLNDYYLVSGMETSILDSDFHTISMARCPYKNFCSLIHRESGAGNLCKVSDIEKLNHVRSNAEPIMYTCPYGITEAIVPIIRGDAIEAYIISSMGINEDKINDEEILFTVQSIIKAPLSAALRSSVESFKHITDRECEGYFSMLKILSEHISAHKSISFGTESVGRLVKNYVKMNLSEKLTLKDIARNLHCSTVTLTEHFKREFGFTIVEYITKKRIQQAEHLLLTTKNPLREIAALCGFADVEYFSRTFKKYYGIAPASWRNKNIQR